MPWPVRACLTRGLVAPIHELEHVQVCPDRVMQEVGLQNFRSKHAILSTNPAYPSVPLAGSGWGEVLKRTIAITLPN